MAFVVVVFLGMANVVLSTHSMSMTTGCNNVVLSTYSMTTGCTSKDRQEVNQSRLSRGTNNGTENEIESQR